MFSGKRDGNFGNLFFILGVLRELRQLELREVAQSAKKLAHFCRRVSSKEKREIASSTSNYL